MAVGIKTNLANLASKEIFRTTAEKELIPMLGRIRDDRIRLEEKWQRYYRLYNCELDKNSYSGRSKIFLAAARATSETFTNAIVRDFFPTTDSWYDVQPIDDISDDLRADALKSTFDYFFNRRQKLKSDAIPAIRQLVNYGTSPCKVGFNDKSLKITRLKRTGNSVKKANQEIKVAYGPYLQPRDLFNFYVWPTTADDVQKATISIEDIEVTLSHLKEYAARPMGANKNLGMVYEIPEEVFTNRGNRSKDWFRFRRERLQRMGLTSDPSDRWLKLDDDRRNLSEVYWTTDLDGTGEKSWLLTIIDDFYVIRIQENPYWHKKRPYIVPRMVRCIGEFYGRGIMETIDRINYMMNDIVNQTMDSVQYEINPISIIDPSGVAFPNSIRAYPGARWLVNDPQKNVVFTKPASVAAVGFSTLSLLQGYIHDFSGANATMQGQPAVRGRGRSQNTASGMQTLLSQGSSGISQIVEDLEQQFGEPLLEMSYANLEQFLDEPIMLRILGRKGGPLLQKEVSIEDIIGDFEFKWLGSTNSRNRQIVGQQMINFLNIARGFPPEIVQSLNWPWLIKKIWVEAFGMRGGSELFDPNGAPYSVDPELEFKLLLQDREIKISPADDNQGHLKQHYLDREKITDEDVLKNMDTHIQAHIDAISAMIAKQKEQQAMQQMQQMMAMQQAGGGKGGKPIGGNNGPQPQNQPSGLSENPLAALMQQLQGTGGGG